MIAHIAKEIKTSTDGIAGINACGDAWSSWKQECSVSWFVGSEAATGTLGELNTCAGYTAPGNNRVVYQFMASPFGIHHPEITGFYHS